MVRVLGCCFAVLFALGCQSNEQPARGARRGIESVQYPPPTKRSREPRDAPRPERWADLPELPTEAEEEQERDLGSELNAAVGIPTECVRDFTAPRPMKIRVSVSATVRPTGMVIMPAAYGSGLSVSARECIERRVGTVVLSALEEPVSQSVSTIIEIDYEPEVIVEADPGVPEPRLRDVREPLPKYPMIPLDAKFIDGWPTSNWISGGFDGGIPMQKDTSKRIRGPKPRPIDGYDVFENAQIWTDQRGGDAPPEQASD